MCRVVIHIHIRLEYGGITVTCTCVGGILVIYMYSVGGIVYIHV